MSYGLTLVGTIAHVHVVDHTRARGPSLRSSTSRSSGGPRNYFVRGSWNSAGTWLCLVHNKPVESAFKIAQGMEESTRGS